MSEVKNILLVGVGGQGTILASKIMTYGLVQAGYEVKMSEIHGMAQRGGSVSTQIRFGEEVFSPIIAKGQADILVAFESMECHRWLEYLKPTGEVVVNDYQIPSVPILAGSQDYPVGILEEIKEKASTLVIKANEIAVELGNAKTMNVVLLGALVRSMNLEHLDWEEAIRNNVKARFIDMNLEAFKLGAATVTFA